MSDNSQHLDTLKDIRQMMERSSRFISLSGLSGIAAGCCALVGAFFARVEINIYQLNSAGNSSGYIMRETAKGTISDLEIRLLTIALITFLAAFTSSFLFTYLRSKKNKIPLWGATAKRLMWNVCIPLFVGGVYLISVLQHGSFELVASGCLLFYGLALVNASKYTLVEIRYLGFGQILLGLLNLYIDDSSFGLYFWALGFGVLHIVYGALMWWKYERN
ncbi:hypothetical protein [Foetidibacter luteolus]|uniref:hypothetical protein n=1 Tax=Foetidibacter luteolus TaxID=2608880 RepID=UPI001A98BF14|nr:hypothetical protein [Foetidibacter luteolus]